MPVRATAPAAPAGVDPLEHRAALVRFGEDQITADANRRVAEGTLKGDHKGTRCELFPETDGRRAAERDPATRVGRYDCVAYTSELEGYTENQALFGDPFWLVDRLRARQARVVQDHAARRRGRQRAGQRARAGAVPGPRGPRLIQPSGLRRRRLLRRGLLLLDRAAEHADALPQRVLLGRHDEPDEHADAR